MLHVQECIDAQILLTLSAMCNHKLDLLVPQINKLLTSLWFTAILLLVQNGPNK